MPIQHCAVSSRLVHFYATLITEVYAIATALRLKGEELATAVILTRIQILTAGVTFRDGPTSHPP